MKTYSKEILKGHLLALAIILCPMIGLSGEPSAAITISPDRKAFFAGAAFDVTIVAPTLVNTTIDYRLSYANRTLSRGSFNVGKDGMKHLSLQAPTLKSGVIASAKLSCVSGNVTASETLHFFPRKAFGPGSGEVSLWHKSDDTKLKEHLETSGATVVSVTDVSQTRTKALVIDGMDLADNPGIVATITTLCQAGTTVSLIAPKGTWPWPKTGERLILDGSEAISRLDKRFDPMPFTTVLTATKVDGAPVLTIEKGSQGFCFCRMQIGKGELIILTCPLTKWVQENPTPVYLIKTMTTKEISK